MRSFKLKTPIFAVILGICVSSLIPVLSRADNHSSAGGDAILTQQEGRPTRKRMPSRNHLDVVYENGILTLLSESYEGEFSLCFENCTSGENYEIPFISVGESVMFELSFGEYEVCAKGEDGLILSGFMEII